MNNATIVLILSFLVSFAVSANVRSKWVLTKSPTACKRSMHCQPNHFCTPDFTLGQLPPNRCVPLRRLGEACESRSFAVCDEGLYCAAGKSVCTPQLGVGAGCELDGECTGDLVCKFGRCAALGQQGDECRHNWQCDRAVGLFCDQWGYMNGTCQRSVAFGASCNLGFTSDPANCVGVCAAPEDGLPHACIPAQREGMICQDKEDCDSALVCNVFDKARRIGVCVREVALLRTVGASCDPRKDECDAAYDLSCRSSPASDGKYVCHQGYGFGTYSGAYCTPGNPLSVCVAEGGFPTECRQDMKVGGSTVHVLKNSFYKCRRVVQRVPAGTPCNPFHGTDVACADGLKCTRVRAVRPYRNFEDLSPIPARYCTKKVPRRGGACTSDFHSRCPKGQICTDGACTDGKRTAKTHAPQNGACGKSNNLPCAPGLVCVGGRCEKPTRVGREGDACLEDAMHKTECEKDLVCFPDATQRNELRCQKRSGDGGLCGYRDEVCQSGLLCYTRYNTPSQCFDPGFLLAKGATCNPRDRNQGGCVKHTTGHPLQCLKSEAGFKCQLVTTVLRRCAVSENVSCQDGIKCAQRDNSS